MLIDRMPEEKINRYIELIQVACSLSKLFSDSDKPYIAYRLTENLFCECFGAENVSRADCSIDAKIGKIGIGIKTFVETGSKKASPQKIAEFNKHSGILSQLSDEALIKKVSEIRNARLEFTGRKYNVSTLIYHCITRDAGTVRLIELSMDSIDTENLRILKSTEANNILFTDGRHKYKFVKSKSTLYTEFDLSRSVLSFGADILENPLELFGEIAEKIPGMQKAIVKPFVMLPLFSMKKGARYVPERSGLNQWNAGGRARNYDEVYIPVPIGIHKKCPGFFPPRETPFKLRLPDGGELSAKICQQNDKALMSNPNSALGKWILRQVLKLDPGELITYEMLEELGIDHVSVTKNGDEDYSIDFTIFAEGESSIDEQPETSGGRILQSKLY